MLSDAKTIQLLVTTKSLRFFNGGYIFKVGIYDLNSTLWRVLDFTHDLLVGIVYSIRSSSSPMKVVMFRSQGLKEDKWWKDIVQIVGEDDYKEEDLKLEYSKSWAIMLTYVPSLAQI